MVSTKCSEEVVLHIRHPDFKLPSRPDVDRDGDDVDGGIVRGGVITNDSSRGSRSFTRVMRVWRGRWFNTTFALGLGVQFLGAIKPVTEKKNIFLVKTMAPARPG